MSPLPLSLVLSLTLTLLSLISLPLITSAAADDCPVEPNALTLMKFNLNVNEEGRTNIKIEAVKSTLERIEQIKTKITVVSIMGKYRTGKSFLMNQLLSSTAETGGRSIFKVGHTVQPETEEVHLFMLPPCAIKSGDVTSDTTLLYLDTPGLFATNRGQVFDSQLLAVMNLISSVMLYNAIGVPDRELINQLSDAIQAAKAVSYFDENKSQDKTIDRPHLFWVLQNHHLAILDHSGKVQTVKSFIQEQLNEVDAGSHGGKGTAARFNEFFKGVDGHTLPYPISDPEQFSQLDQKTDADFTTKYKEARTALRSKIYGVMAPKKLGNDAITGSMLAELIRQWVENVNIPVNAARENSASVLLKHIEDKEVNKAVSKYQEMMNALTLPVHDSELSKASQQAVEKALENVKEADMPTLVSAVREKVTALYKDYVAKNEGNMRSALEGISARVLEAHKKRVDELTLPTTQAKILETLEQTKTQWNTEVTPFRAAAGAHIPDYEPKINDAIEESKKSLFSQNLQLHAKKIIETFIKENDALMKNVPVEQSEVDSVRNTAVTTWNAVASDMSQADTSELANHGAGVMGQIRAHSSALHTLNMERSITECTNKAKVLVDQALVAFSGWDTYQSASAFDEQLRQIQESPYCRGPGRNASAVTWNFHRVRADYAATLHQHILISHAFTLLAWALAVYAGISIPQLAVANHWDSTQTGAWNQTLCKIYPFMGAGLIYISRLLPDAIWSIHMNYIASLILFIAFALGLKITFKSWRRKTEARWD